MTGGEGFAVFYQDEHLVVVHKEAGLLTVPSHGEPALVDRLEARLDKERFGRHRLRVVHRLDRQTSGLLVFARTPTVAAALAKLFAAHRVERRYRAIVAGRLTEERGVIDAKLDGKRALTRYEIVLRLEDATELSIQLGTGRRNQIRRHFADRGHPILGDSRYRADLALRTDWPLPRLALHAETLGFVHPMTRAALRFSAAVPWELSGRGR